jgi:hypothetical protein
MGMFVYAFVTGQSGRIESETDVLLRAKKAFNMGFINFKKIISTNCGAIFKLKVNAMILFASEPDPANPELVFLKNC